MVAGDKLQGIGGRSALVDGKLLRRAARSHYQLGTAVPAVAIGISEFKDDIANRACIDEVGHIVASLSHREGVACVGGDHRAALGPVPEGVARGSRGGQGAACAVVVGAGARDGSASKWVGYGGDSVAVDLEIGNIIASLSHVEGVAGIGRNHRTVLRPVYEGVASVGCGSQGA